MNTAVHGTMATMEWNDDNSRREHEVWCQHARKGKGLLLVVNNNDRSMAEYEKP